MYRTYAQLLRSNREIKMYGFCYRYPLWNGSAYSRFFKWQWQNPFENIYSPKNITVWRKSFIKRIFLVSQRFSIILSRSRWIVTFNFSLKTEGELKLYWFFFSSAARTKQKHNLLKIIIFSLLWIWIALYCITIENVNCLFGFFYHWIGASVDVILLCERYVRVLWIYFQFRCSFSKTAHQWNSKRIKIMWNNNNFIHTDIRRKTNK